MQITPLVLKMIIHYHVQSHVPYAEGDYSHQSSQAVVGAKGVLQASGMIKRFTSTDNRDDLFCLTEKGKFYLNYLLDTPLPTETYEIRREG